MITKIALQNLKCFGSRAEFPMSQITLLYGKNGRGKSTLAQSLLILSQTILFEGSPEVLQLNGRQINLGFVSDVLNINNGNENIIIDISTDMKGCEEMHLEYEDDNNQRLLLSKMVVDGINRFEEFEDTTGKRGNSFRLGTTSDIALLEQLKDLAYVSADRMSLGEAENVVPESRLLPSGKNMLGVLIAQNSEFLNNIQEALSFILSGATVDLKRVDNRVELRLNSLDNDDTYRAQNVGFGYSYVLPIIVSTLLAKKDSILVIENPEAHLHTAAQSRIMEFLVEQAKKKNLQLIVETHSDHVINGMRIAVRKSESLLSASDCGILYFDYAKSQKGLSLVEPIRVNEQGHLSSYPDDFMDEWTKQMMELL